MVSFLTIAQNHKLRKCFYKLELDCVYLVDLEEGRSLHEKIA